MLNSRVEASIAGIPVVSAATPKTNFPLSFLFYTQHKPLRLWGSSLEKGARRQREPTSRYSTEQI